MKKDCSNIQYPISNIQTGQTLIETLAAIFILVMGVSSAVGLAIYAFNSSSSVTKQIIATGLAREGIEAVMNMRDTNWLQQTTIDNNCYNFASSTAMNANCYTHWLGTTPSGVNVPFCLDPTANNGNNCNGDDTSQNYTLTFDSTSGNFWLLARQRGANINYGLQFDPNLIGNKGLYYSTSDGSANSGVACADGASMSDYCRKIIITKNPQGNVAPYNQATTGPLLEVQSQVWWVDKKCPRSADWPGAGKCSLELDTYLTNWKDY